MLPRQFRRVPRLVAGRCPRFSSISASVPDASEPMSMAEQKRLLAKAALEKVPIHGWTQDAITAAVLEHPQMTISMSGLLTPSDLVTWLMEDFNEQLRTDPEKRTWSVFEKIKWRLEQVIPLAKSGQWHQGMAKGLQTPLTTRSQLHEFIELSSPPGSSLMYQTALGGIFVASELHLLTDSSPDYQETWNFLEARIDQLEQGQFVNLTGDAASIPMAASTAVAASVFDGLASLVLPSSTASAPGSNPNDYKTKSNK